ncbi:uncharacterized protein BCR38DRAFT_458507 [Pseudomassariella vexata]|uniref:Major facilitator superfamily domain-containing protein n=1 Tax=Pseudomassariella vexata TaxID=1141098 RepID=A0A1Y2DVQ5_9PEZI|nr:uncharacterized protein BCR38DRAFT_458507 [Pseudomassariella vexata]ORY63351.1 hypothetical protein BCR38DRAFT_458507 [Pseudomassariella vexata]
MDSRPTLRGNSIARSRQSLQGMISGLGLGLTSYYESGELFKASSTGISWIGFIQSFLLQLIGLIAGPVYDRGYLRLLLITTASWQFRSYDALPEHRIVASIAGASLLPRASAVGIASTGGVIYPIVLTRLIPQVGFPWAVRCVGFVALAAFIIPLAVLRIRVRVPKPRAMVDWSVFRDAPFMFFTLGVLIVFIAQTVVVFYIYFYPADRSFTDTSLVFYMAAIFNAGSVLGRILPNALSDRIGLFSTIVPLTVLLGVTIICLLGVCNAAGIFIEVVVTAFFSGVIIALPHVCFRVLTENESMIGTRRAGFCDWWTRLVGWRAECCAGLGTTVDPLNGTGLWVYGGATACVAGLIYVCVRIMRSGLALNMKV